MLDVRQYLLLKSFENFVISDFICSVFARFYKCILRLTGFFLVSLMSDSMKIASWSETTGIGVHRFIRLGRLLRNKSNMLSARIRKVTICSSAQLPTISKDLLLIL